MDPWPPTIGTVTQIGPGHEILLIEHPDNPNNGEQYIVTVLDDARISRLTANGPVPASFGDLRTGMRVAVILVGVVLDSYPALGTAGEVIILRTDTDGPADPEDIVTMEMDFYIVTGLFANQPPPPLNDAFVVSYAVAGGERGDLYFCGDRAGETEKCQDGPVYHLQLETPRGAELSYEVKRLPGRDKSRGELIESDRVIMDLDLATRSHYRYGASNPGGYN